MLRFLIEIDTQDENGNISKILKSIIESLTCITFVYQTTIGIRLGILMYYILRTNCRYTVDLINSRAHDLESPPNGRL